MADDKRETTLTNIENLYGRDGHDGAFERAIITAYDAGRAAAKAEAHGWVAIETGLPTDNNDHEITAQLSYYPPFVFLADYDTDDEQWTFWDPVSDQWMPIPETWKVLAWRNRSTPYQRQSSEGE